VYAIEVGHDQLHPSLRRDDRVVVREGLNARHLEPQDIALIDVSRISLWLILPALIDVVDERAEIIVTADEIIALVKPQFEVGKEALPGDGVVKREADRDAVLDGIRQLIESDTPWSAIGEMKSPIEGEKGNTEFFLHIR
jgi:23S rRNA (cytidine1920-2'-O)/16S rRNA (cytidine1409-2'-O)-methyltransferase